jgi:uncharacterized protein YbjT (DUF2867 family)
MKILIIGGTGLIGSKVTAILRAQGHDVIAASPQTGVNTITREGLPEAVNGTDVVIDLSNSPSWEDNAVLEFFTTSGRNLLAAEINAGVKHHLALSIVGVDQMQNVGYMRAKIAQEDLIKRSGVPYTILRSTQFLEFLAGIANQATQDNEVHLSDIKFQPIASDDVAAFVANAAVSAPVNETFEIAGPERFTMAEIVSRFLKDTNDKRAVVANSDNHYYGGTIPNAALVPANNDKAKLGALSYEKWLSKQMQRS